MTKNRPYIVLTDKAKSELKNAGYFVPDFQEPVIYTFNQERINALESN